MYKAQKDAKIIAINDTGDFPCLVYDEVVEDTEHTIEDYTHYNGEFILKTDVPAPTEEEQRQKRAEAYANEVDPITAHIQRLRDEEQTEEVVAKIQELIEERRQVVEKIQRDYPYPVQEPEYEAMD